MNNNKKGFSLIEIIVYIGVLSFISIIIVNSLITSFSYSSSAFEKRNLLASGSSVIDRISREIRLADQIVDINSVFDSDNGVLELSSSDSIGNTRIVKFQLNSGGIEMYEDDVLYDRISGNKINVESIVFKKISTSSGLAVKIELSLIGENDKVVNFYNTISLRGAY